MSLIDRQTNMQIGPFILVAKFVDRRRSDARLEVIAVLGMIFLANNDLRLALEGARGQPVGSISVP